MCQLFFCQRVKRRDVICAKSLIRDNSRIIVDYILPKKSGLSQIKFKPLIQMQKMSYIRSSGNALGIIVTVWVPTYRDTANPRPNWSGFMQDVTIW